MMALFAVTMAATAGEVTITQDAATMTWTAGTDDTYGQGFSTTAEGFNLGLWKNKSTSEIVEPAKEIRVYKNAVLVIEAVSGEAITKVVITTTTTKYAVDMTANGVANGAVADTNAKTVTWSGNTNKLVLEATVGQVRVTSLVITYGEAEPVSQVEKPVLSLKPGTFYGPIELTCTTATEGATILFSKDGGETYNEYTAPIAIGTSCEVDVYAVKDGLEDSEHVTAQYTITKPYDVASIAEAVAEAANNTVVKFVKPVTCVFQYGSYTYVKDETGSTLIYGSGLPTYTNGSVIPGGFFGKMTIYNNLVEFTTEIVKNEYYTTASFAESTETVEPIKPTDVKIADITTDMMNQYIVLSNVTFDAETNTLVDGDNSIAIYDRKFCSLPETGTYDVICVVSVFKTTLQVYPIEFALAGTVGAELINATEIDDNAPVYNLLGQPVSRDTKNQILVKNGKKFINK